MPTLRTGLVAGGVYATKIRKTLFVQIRGLVKSRVLKEEPSDSEIVRAAGELNRILYEILVDRVKIEKGDVVRINVNYMVEEGKIKWDLETLNIQVWKRAPEEDINKAIAEVKLVARKPMARRAPSKILPYIALRIAEADTGDIVYSIRLTRGNINIGLLRAIPLLENKALIWGAILDPIPLIIEEIVEDVKPSLDSYINTSIEDIIDRATPAEREEAEKILNRIKTIYEKLRNKI